MKKIKISRLVFLIIALVSVGLMAWAIAKGAAAPESSDIAKSMALVGQVNEAGDEIVLDDKQVPVPVKSTEEGIKAAEVVFTYQYRADDVYTGYVADLSNKRVSLESYLADMAAFEQDTVMNYEQAVARIAELEGAKSQKDKKERDELVARVEAYDNLAKEAKKLQALINPDAEADDVAQVLYFAEGSKKQCEERIAALEAELANEEKIVANDANVARIAELKAQSETKKLSKAEQKELETAEAAVKAYEESVAKLNSDIKTEKENLDTWSENISRLQESVAKSKADGEAIAALAQAVSVNLYWFYGLMVFAICFVIFAWVLGMIQNPGSIWKTCVYMAVVAIVVVGAWFVADANGWGFVNENGDEVGRVLHDVTGEPLGIGSGDQHKFFEKWHYMTADVSILVTYIAFAGAALAAVFSWIRGSFKS